MPLYTFHCELDGVFELLLPMAEFERKTAECPTCGTVGPRVAELCAMQPDNAWHFGRFVEGHGYLSSKSKIARAEKANGIATLSGRYDVEGMKKVAADARKANDEKRRRNLRRAFDDTFAGTGVLDSFGQLRPEAIKQDDPSVATQSVTAKVS